MIDRLKALDAELKGKGSGPASPMLSAKRAEVLELRNRIDGKIKELEGQLKIAQGRLEAPLIAKLREAMNEIGKEQGVALIFDRSTPGLVYVGQALDLTDQVIARFEAKD